MFNQYINSKTITTAAAIVVLFLGGAGSFALWHDTATTAEQVINTGKLSFTSQAATTYLLKPSGQTAVDLAEHRLVAGEKIRIVKPVTVVLQGQNLKAQLALTDIKGLKFTGAAQNGFTILSSSGLYSDVNGATRITDVNGYFQFTGTSDGQPKSQAHYIIIDIEFAADGTSHQDSTATIAGLNATLQQVAPGT